MAEPDAPETPRSPEIDPTPGLAGGPGPTPPGIEDGTPRPVPAAPETPPGAGRAAEGKPGGRPLRDPEEPDPS